MAMFIFYLLFFQPRKPFLGKFGSEIQNCLFNVKFGIWIKSNTQNSMLMFNFSVFDCKYLFLTIWFKNQNCQFKLKFGTRYFSHLTKNCVFRNLDLKRKIDHNFAAISRETISGTKNCIQILQADWSEVVVIWAPFEGEKVKVHIFDMTNLAGFTTWEFTTKKELNPRKQTFLLNLMLRLTQKPKIWSIFYRKIFI